MDEKDSIKISLADVQKQVNASRGYYLEQDGSYGTKWNLSANRIIEDYLNKFMDVSAGHAPAIQEIARDTIDEIKSFNERRVDFALHLAELHTSINLVLGSLQLYVLKSSMDEITRVCDNAFKTFQGQKSSDNEPRESFEDVAAKTYEDAKRVGMSLVSIQKLTGDIIRIRSEIVDSIEQGYLTVTLKDAVGKMLDHLVNTSREEFFDKAWDAVSKNVAEALSEVLEEEIPTKRIKRILTGLAKIIGMKKMGTNSKNDSNEMAKIISLLREHEAMFRELEKKARKVEKEKNRILEYTNIEM